MHNQQNQAMAPAQLLIGTTAATQQAAITIMQQTLCAQAGCGSCKICKQISERRSYSMLWLAPEKQYYAKADLEQLGQRLSFALEDGESFFIILEAVDLLPPAAGNSLLKTLEEPPRGYHFLLFTERPALVMPTIISRCVERHCEGGAQVAAHGEMALLLARSHFEQLKKMASYDFASFTQEETLLLLDKLIAEQRKRDAAHGALPLLLDAYAQLPMPGSAKLFWRTLFLNLALLEETSSY